MPYSVVSLRRYPVKSMGGEALASAGVDERGIVLDRWFAVRDTDGRFASGKNTRRFRRRDAVFRYSATAGTDGQVVVSTENESWTVGDPALDEHLSGATGTVACVTAEGSVPHQDMGPVSIVGTATMQWCADKWGGSADPRRLRTNIVVRTERPFEEESWAGHILDFGTAVIRVTERVPRCRTIDLVQDGCAPMSKWLTPLTAERDMYLAMYAEPVTPGVIEIGDVVRPRRS